MNIAQHNVRHLGESDIGNDVTVGSSVRKCWATARERNRMKARYAIHQRVFGNTTATPPCDVDDDDTAVAAAATQRNVSSLTVRDDSIKFNEKIRHVLHRIIRGDTSYFSLQFMEEHFDVLNDPFPSQLLWETNDDVPDDVAPGMKSLLDTVRLRSRLGQEKLARLECYVSDRNTCSVLEFAVWLKRYRIIRQLIIGGLDPIQCKSMILSEEHTHRAKEIGMRIRQLFFSGRVPLSLSCYIICTVIGLRQSTWDARQTMLDEASSFSPSNRQVGCMICHVTTDLLRFLPSQRQKYRDRCRSEHHFCELCIWNDVLKHLDNRVGDVVQCPICHHHNSSDGNVELRKYAVKETRQHLYSISLVKFNSLPKDSLALKKLVSKKKTTSELDTICSTWSEAVRPFVGMTQTSRRDKFFHFVEKGSYHHVKACIDQGIGLNVQNEYGQTALFIAVWQNDIQLVRLLLNHGCDHLIVASGNITPYTVANAYGYKDALALLEQLTDPDHNHDDDTLSPLPNNRFCNVLQSSNLSVNTVIDFSVDHPGAGSFVVDDFLDDSFIDSLFDLWMLLPMELAARKKLVPCSERRYYCDVHETITKSIAAMLTRANGICSFPFTKVLCGPHMRFLNYSERGAILPPHIDLSRTDPSTSQRSTHSFLLYLSTCKHGGETALLGAVTGDGRNQRLATVAPKRGRILIFPHRCPHEGLVVVDVPKLLIRGELWMA